VENPLKAYLSELIIALTLIVNPVAMHASVLYGAHLHIEQSKSMAISQATVHAPEQPMAAGDPSTHCGMSCCDAPDCRSLQTNTCTLHHYPVMATQEARAIATAVVDRKYPASPTSLSDRDPQPELPPPKRH
jgi:hypothetical protein